VIPSDHFVRFYNEVFKALDELGRSHLIAYWRELGDMQSRELAETFRAGGLQACHDYWGRIIHEENCEAEMKLSRDYFEFRMHRCPSLSKVLDNDASPCALYCDHCMGWIEPVMKRAGLHVAYDMESRSQPHCVFRVYTDPAQAAEFARQAKLPAFPYRDEAVPDSASSEEPPPGERA